LEQRPDAAEGKRWQQDLTDRAGTVHMGVIDIDHAHVEGRHERTVAVTHARCANWSRKESAMTQITPEQPQQTEETATRVAAKLRAFHDSLPAEEQFALHVGLGHPAAGAAGTEQDVAGYQIGGVYQGASIASLGYLRPSDWCGTCRDFPWAPGQGPGRFPRLA
jgi:hypothetical protein